MSVSVSRWVHETTFISDCLAWQTNLRCPTCRNSRMGIYKESLNDRLRQSSAATSSMVFISTVYLLPRGCDLSPLGQAGRVRQQSTCPKVTSDMFTILQLAGNHMESKCWKASGSYVNFLLKKYAKEIVSSATEIWALQIRYLILNRAHISKNNYVVLPDFSSNWATYRACVQYGYPWSSANKYMFAGMQK